MALQEDQQRKNRKRRDQCRRQRDVSLVDGRGGERAKADLQILRRARVAAQESPGSDHRAVADDAVLRHRHRDVPTLAFEHVDIVAEVGGLDLDL